MVATRSSLAPRILPQQLAATSFSTVKGYNKKKRKYNKKVSVICTPRKAPPVPSPPVPPKESNGNTLLQFSTSTIAPKQVPSPPMVPLRSTSDRPLLIPCDQEQELRETKFKLNPLSRLKQPPRTNHKPEMLEKSKMMIAQVKSMLVSELTSVTITNVEDMVDFANGVFNTLNWLGADYDCFYRDVKELISNKYELQIEEKKGNILTFLELERTYEEVVIRADDIAEAIINTQAKLKMANEETEHVKRGIEKAEELIQRLKQMVAEIKDRVEHLKCDEQKYKKEHEAAQAEVEKLGTQVEAAKAVKKEVERRKDAAHKQIESITRRLQCMN
ncbi:uncharacterized protein [Nicotiana sylvestris]|uniref:ELKS/Rab6-interacting/CAST family member 1-like n=1 Tax=Nicotiana sylvestris TaxID=4096 RepID=A0A1U7VFU8_NICSY|nr:PREDICTED: ELKS/Rab6-interacting/CAST family member 1-like [Nicotiana sylvestris]